MARARPDLRYALPNADERLFLIKAITISGGNPELLREEKRQGSIQELRALRAAAELYRRMISDGRPLISDLARDLGLSPEELSRQFGRILGVSPHSLRSAIRAVMGAQILLTGTAAKRTALALGYTDPSAFSRAFQKFFAVTPSKVRFNVDKLDLGRLTRMPVAPEVMARCAAAA